MRLALILDRFDPGIGGLENWAWQWTLFLLDRGHEVVVIAAEVADDLARPGLTSHALGRSPSRLAFAERIAAFLDRIQVDIIHDLGAGWRYDILQPQFGTRLADDRRNLRALPFLRRIEAHFSWRRRRRLADIRALETRQYVGATGRVVAVSARTQEDLAHEHRLSPDRVTVIHNGVDPARYEPVDRAQRLALRKAAGVEDKLVLLFAAHNFRLKGLETVLRALRRLRAPAALLYVVGNGPIERNKRLADRLGVGDNVHFAGYSSDMRQTFALADAFVQPTFYDPCSLTILEAAASGLPVLTSRFNGASELFVDRRSALIIADPGDDAEVAAAITTLMDADTRRALSQAGQLVAQHATAEANFTRLFDLCQRVMAERATP